LKIAPIIAVIFLLNTGININEAYSKNITSTDSNCLIREIKIGLLYHDPDHLWSQQRKEDGLDLNFETVFAKPSIEKLKGKLMPNFGVSINTSGDTSKLYGGIIWEHIFNQNIFLNLGIGAAVHNGELETDDNNKKELGSRILFRIPIEIGYILDDHHRISLAFDHVSNAWLANENEGLDTIGLRYGYVF